MFRIEIKQKKKHDLGKLIRNKIKRLCLPDCLLTLIIYSLFSKTNFLKIPIKFD